MILQNKAISINKTVDTKKVSHKNLLSGITTILPILVWMIAFFVVPLIFIIIVSFCTRGETGEIIYKFTLSNYIKLLNPLYIKIFFNSIIIAVFTTLICLILGYPFAYIVANAKKI